MNSNRYPIRLDAGVLDRYRHVCTFFHTLDEEYQVLLPFIQEGIERGEKAFHIVNPQFREEHLRRLQSAGIPVAETLRTGQLEVRRWDETYLRDGSFDPDAMIELIEEVLRRGKAEGYPLTRVIGQMDWPAKNRSDRNDLLEYEARLNYLLSKYDDPLICTYSIAQFDAGVILDVLRTHPMAIVGGILHENPYFVPPDDFLRELRERRAAGPS